MSSEKKRKTGVAGVTADADTGSWRVKCIDKFGLRPLPNDAAIGSEDAWKRYYEFRSREEAGSASDEENSEFLEEWKGGMAERTSKYLAENQVKWHWTPMLGGDLVWEDYDHLRTAEYYSTVWSPYAIPHAIALMHRYHNRVRMHSVEFHTFWAYSFVDCEDESTIDGEGYRKICSNHFEDEELRADVIKFQTLNASTCEKLRKFLYGAQCQEVTCSDMDFWLLLFGSMGTIDSDLEEDPKGGQLGYVWQPYRDSKMRKFLYDLKAVEGDEEDEDEEGGPDGPFDEYYPSGCSWLKHRVMEISDNLGAVTKHYKHPTIEDAIGYRSEEYGDDDEEEEWEGNGGDRGGGKGWLY